MYYIIFRRKDHHILSDHIYWSGFTSKERVMTHYRQYCTYPATFYRILKIIEINDDIHRGDEEYNALFPETHHYACGKVNYK